MDDHEKSDRPVRTDEARRTIPGDRGRRWWREGACPRGTRPAKHAPDAVPGWACPVTWIVCARWRGKDKDVRFTALLHHVTVDRLREAYRAISPDAAPGVDGVTWRDYGQDLEANLSDLHARVHRGAYRASPTRRVFIPKPDGRLRPLGVAAVEDKILQRAVVEVLNAVFEQDFLGFSYGFRPGRGAHDALDALAVGIARRKVNWVLDADIRDFFTRLDQGWLERFLEHRIADRRVLRLIQKWLRAGVIEESRASDRGSTGPAADPEMAQGRSHRGRGMVRHRTGHRARGVRFAAACQRLPARVS